MRRLLLVFAFLAALAQPAHAICYRHVFIFDAYWCGFCKQTKDFLSYYGIPFEAVETTNNWHWQSIMNSNFGHNGVPVTVIDGDWRGTMLVSGTIIVGYNEPQLRAALCIQ